MSQSNEDCDLVANSEAIDPVTHTQTSETGQPPALHIRIFR